MADVVIINKIDSAEPKAVDQLRENIRKVNPKAIVIDAASPIFVEHPERLTGKRALVVEDGPTLTHGEMKIGAGVVAAQKFGASRTGRPAALHRAARSPRPSRSTRTSGCCCRRWATATEQVKDLETTINRVPCDVVVIGTPIDLNRIVKIKKPTVRVTYQLQEIGTPNLDQVVGQFVKTFGRL